MKDFKYIISRIDEIQTQFYDYELMSFFKDSFYDFPLKDDCRHLKRKAAYSLLLILFMEMLHCEKPRDIRTTYLQYGNLVISNRYERRNIWANVSYSGEYAMAGVASHPIGVDIQKVRNISDLMYRELLMNDEKSWARDLSNKDRVQLFSLKESYAKACCLGITWPSSYAEYTSEYTLTNCYGNVLSRPIEIKDEGYVASISIL